MCSSDLWDRPLMSIVRQERLLWTSLGLVTGAVSFIDVRRSLWSSTSALADKFPSPPPPPAPLPADEPVFGSRARLGLVRTWNSSVDRVFGDITRFLSDRNL